MPSTVLSPRSEVDYKAILARAFGVDPSPSDLTANNLAPHVLATWSNSSRAVLRAAMSRLLIQSGVKTREARERSSEIVPSDPRFRAKRVRSPSFEEGASLEQLLTSQPAVNAALMRLLMFLGLRADSLLHLARPDVEAAVTQTPHELAFRVKGGSEKHLPLDELAVESLRTLLGMKAKGPPLADTTPPDWQVAGQILSDEGYRAQYQQLSRLVHKLGAQVGDPGLSPHKLRHFFASWLYDRTGDALLVKEALGHSNLQTTLRYIDISSSKLRAAMSRGGSGATNAGS